ncbi:hypothetical protein EIP91_001994 [Steccherinum ochraceum]|uniref:Cyclin N-terminal domain-containing protein n=1 Tax=Steccherinum ochraceum TaxID=92696 RepID=A0A4R0RFD3_9APHY|nr:hypothetical protein EIP91_001994 [Steccherinum ochraceum]
MHPKYSPESPLHEASLVDYTLHSPAILELLDIKISRTLIDYIVDCTCETVDHALGRSVGSSRTLRKANHQFVTDVIHKAEVKLPVLLVALVYIDRARAHLEIAIDQYAFERVFLGGVILANKYLNDSTLKNVHWAMCSRIFRTRDIGRIEREFLDVLDFELGVSEADVLSHHATIMSLQHPQRTCPLQSAILSPMRSNSHRRQVSLQRAPSEATTLVLDDMDVSEGSSSSSRMDVEEPIRKVTSFKHHHSAADLRMDVPQPPQGIPLHRTQPRVFAHHPPLVHKPTPYVDSAQPHSSSHRLSIPSAFSIFKSFPIFHHNPSHSDSPTESTSSSGTACSVIGVG